MGLSVGINVDCHEPIVLKTGRAHHMSASFELNVYVSVTCGVWTSGIWTRHNLMTGFAKV